MKTPLLIKKLLLRKDKFIVADALKNYCGKLGIDYTTTIAYLLRNRYVIRILKGIFYILSIEERKLKKLEINYLDALRKALEIKNVKHWYFGLETAIKLNNLSHEYFTVDYLITDSVFRPKPINVLGHTIKFVKMKKELVTFGIINKGIRYSNKEKTVLDVVYLGKYHGLSCKAIKNNIADYLDHCAKKKMKSYLKKYPKSVRTCMEELL